MAELAASSIRLGAVGIDHDVDHIYPASRRAAPDEILAAIATLIERLHFGERQTLSAG